AIISSQARLVQTFEKLYGDDALTNSAFIEYKKALEAIDREAKDNLDPAYQKAVLEPLARFASYFPEINEAVKRRNKKLLDYDAQRSKVRKLIDKPSDDPQKLPRAEQEANLAREMYESINTILIQDLPKVVDLRVPYLDPIFEALVKSELVFSQTGYEKIEGMRNFMPSNYENDSRVDDVLQQMRGLTICEHKKEKKVKPVKEDDSLRFLSPIAHPLAEEKLTKKIFKTVKKASKVKHLRRGVKEVGKALRKGEKGLVIIAGDISPMDVISHLPVLCEDANVPYVFVPSKEQLGEASATKRPTSVSMVVFGGKNKDAKSAEDYKDLYEECYTKAKELDEKLVY
ncbi:hypothetical protein BDF20DRAFT_825615, partial [Mycotypha africana]|uniref:uncharacterized protein n=1 Tax=Mycotypha africana TaxID=64632 RepID=UPI002300DA04